MLIRERGLLLQINKLHFFFDRLVVFFIAFVKINHTCFWLERSNVGVAAAIGKYHQPIFILERFIDRLSLRFV